MYIHQECVKDLITSSSKFFSILSSVFFLTVSLSVSFSAFVALFLFSSSFPNLLLLLLSVFSFSPSFPHSLFSCFSLFCLFQPFPSGILLCFKFVRVSVFFIWIACYLCVVPMKRFVIFFFGLYFLLIFMFIHSKYSTNNYLIHAVACPFTT